MHASARLQNVTPPMQHAFTHACIPLRTFGARVSKSSILRRRSVATASRRTLPYQLSSSRRFMTSGASGTSASGLRRFKYVRARCRWRSFGWRSRSSTGSMFRARPLGSSESARSTYRRTGAFQCDSFAMLCVLDDGQGTLKARGTSPHRTCGVWPHF